MTIEDYIIKHSGGEDPILNELERETNLKVLMPRMLSGKIQGKFLEYFSKMHQVEKILELGTFTGYSAICLAKGLGTSGKLDTIEINEELEKIARKYFAKAGFENKITLYIGDAIEIIPVLNSEYDLIFIDADKRLYPQYYKLVFDKLKVGGFILADNVLWGNKVVDKIEENDLYTKGIIEFNKIVNEDKRVENFIIPERDGLMIIKKKY